MKSLIRRGKSLTFTNNIQWAVDVWSNRDKMTHDFTEMAGMILNSVIKDTSKFTIIENNEKEPVEI